MGNQPTEADAMSVTKATVAPGLGFPANRSEISPMSTGWRGTSTSKQEIELIEKVSRETFKQ